MALILIIYIWYIGEINANLVHILPKYVSNNPNVRLRYDFGTVLARVRGGQQFKKVYILNISQLRSEGGGVNQFPTFPSFKIVHRILGGGQENYGLFPQFVTFFVWKAPLYETCVELAQPARYDA